jgi:hypothetical protein
MDIGNKYIGFINLEDLKHIPLKDLKKALNLMGLNGKGLKSRTQNILILYTQK